MSHTSNRRKVVIAGGLFLILRNLLRLRNLAYGKKKLAINYPNKDIFSEVSLDLLALRGIQYGLLYDTLLKLERLSVIRILYRSRRKIIVEVHEEGRRLFEALAKISSRGNVHCDITVNDAKFLFIVNTLGFLPSISELASRLSISKHSAIKLVNKHKELGLIEPSTGLLTSDGQIFLDWLFEIIDEKIFAGLRRHVSRQIHSPCTVGKHFAKKVYSLIRDVEGVIKYNLTKNILSRELKIAIIGIGEDRRILDAVKVMGNTLRKRFTDVVSMAWIMDNKLLISDLTRTENQPYSVRHIMNLIWSHEDNNLIILITNRMIMELIGRKISSMVWKGPKIIMVTKIGGIGITPASADRVEKRGNILLRTIVDSFRNRNRLVISGQRWGSISIDTRREVPIGVLKDALLLNTASLSKGWCVLPQGILRIDMNIIGKYVKTDGFVKIMGEPIYGLKCQSSCWMRDVLSHTICEYNIHQNNDNIVVDIKMSKIRYIQRHLDGGIIKSIAFGLNTTNENEMLRILRENYSLVPYMDNMMSIEIHKKEDDAVYRYIHVIGNTQISANGNKIY